MKKVFLIILLIVLSSCAKQVERAVINIDLSITSPDGEVLSQNIEILEDDSVLSVLKNICDENDIEYKIIGNGVFSYLSSLAGYEEKSMGAESGWVYKVNDVSPSKGIGSYKLKDNDKIEFIFILEQKG